MLIIDKKKIKNIFSKIKINKLPNKKNGLLDDDNNSNTINILKPQTQNLLFRILFILANLTILMINIYFLKQSKNINMRNKIYYRNNDEIFIDFYSNSYTKIGNILNKKFYNKYSDIIISTKNDEKKIIRLFAVNLCSKEEFKQTLLWYLKDKYIVEFDKENPDYLIYNVFGIHEILLQYNNCIKIALYTENIIPDLSECDYALGHAHISFLDRYFTLPFCFLRRLNETKHLNLTEIRNNVIKNPRKKFCAGVISNPTYSFRILFIDELNKYKQVDMGGSYKNNVGLVKNKTEFLSDYKFTISMENSYGDGYASEKIIDSFISGTIPIYYGNNIIDEYINPKSYILINGPQDMNQKIEYIKKIDNDNELYKSILKEKVYLDDKMLEKLHKEQSEFWFHIFDQDKNKAKRNFF